MIADWLSRSIHFDENHLFILSKVTNIDINHNHKQWKLMHKQQLVYEQVDIVLQAADTLQVSRIFF